MGKLKVLVVGDVKGQIDVVYAKVAAFNASKAGPFDLLFCVGQFFSSAAANGAIGSDELAAYVEGEKQAPIRTYFVTGSEPVPPYLAGCDDGAELCENVTFLGNAGIRTIRGLSVAFLSGAFSPFAPPSAGFKFGPQHVQLLEQRVASRLNASTARGTSGKAGSVSGASAAPPPPPPQLAGVDVLLTPDWALGVDASTVSAVAPPQPNQGSLGNVAVGAAARAVAPRYHFAGGGGRFFERCPYRNEVGSATHTTRFLGLGPVTAHKPKSKEGKWIYGVAIAAGAEGAAAAAEPAPPDTTPCPYPAPGPPPPHAQSSVPPPMPPPGAPPPAKRARVGPVPPAGASGANFTPAMARQIEAEAGASAGSFFFGGGARGTQTAAPFVAQRGQAPPASEHKAFVGGISYRVDANRLWEAFQSCGELLETKLVMDRDNGGHGAGGGSRSGMGASGQRHKGFGFVTFATAEGLDKALQTMEGFELEQRALRIGRAKKRNALPVGSSAGEGARCGPGESMPKLFSQVRNDCWFCLASPQCETWLVSSMGNEAYMCLAKGALSPEHQLVVPIEHSRSFAALQREHPSCVAEVWRYRDALVRYNAARHCGTVATERFTATRGAVHTHLQTIAVPLGDLASPAFMAHVRGAFEREGAKQGVQFTELPPEVTLAEAAGESFYFYVEIFSSPGNPPARLLFTVNGPFRAQFAREVLARDVLQAPRKANWKACVVPQAEEARMTEQFKDSFKAYDFTLDDGYTADD